MHLLRSRWLAGRLAAYLPLIATLSDGTELNSKCIGIEKNGIEILDLMMKRYDRRLRPQPLDGGPTNVSIDCFVRGIYSIDEIAMEYTVDLLVRQRWNDKRLSFESKLGANLTIPYINGDKKLLEKIWLPDLFFANEKQAFIHEVSVPNVMLRIFPTGDLLYSTRFTLVLSCEMNLRNYPFDTQTCRMQMGSFSLTDRLLLFVWKTDKPITINDNLQLPKYNLTNMAIRLCKNEHYTGNFSCLKAEFVFNRELGYHLVQAYLPNLLLVIASWISFWLDIDSVPGRITLGVTTLLTTTAQANNIKHTLPPVSYTKAIDVWLGACTTFVFLALLEFSIVNFLARRDSKLALNRNADNKHQRLGDNDVADNATLSSGICSSATESPQKFRDASEIKPLLNHFNSNAADFHIHKLCHRKISINGKHAQMLSTVSPCKCADCNGPICMYGTKAGSAAIAQPTRQHQLIYAGSKSTDCFSAVYASFCDGYRGKRAKLVDNVSRVAFPILFLVFMAIYACIYAF